MGHSVIARTKWGLPDWQCADEYSLPEWVSEDRGIDDYDFIKIGYGPLHRWRWEFYRRRDDLRIAFDERAQSTYEHYCEIARLTGRDESEVLTPDQPGFVAQSYMQDGFGYAGIPNPRISDQPDHVLCPSLDPTLAGHAHYGRRGERVQKIGIEKHEVAFVFDLRKPLEEQLFSAKHTLKSEQLEMFGKKLQKRRRSNLWRTYLRVLDARECKASWAKIAKILPTGSKNEQAARDTWDHARALCFNF